MEVHPAYAVVLDEEGRFLKAANLRYQVGDTVRDIVELRRPKEKRPALWKPLSGVAGLAACLCIVFFGYYQPNFVPYGALRIQINPDVELTLSRTDRVLELEGLNEDGQSLIAGYEYSGKDREDVTGELVERAIDLGYLSGGETVSITVTSADADWQAREEQEAREALEEREGLRLRQGMEQLRAWGTDCTALGSQVAQADPARWEKLRGEWEERFSTIPYEVRVQVSVSRTYGDLA